MGVEDLEGLLTVGRQMDDEPLLLQGLPQTLPEGRLVVDDQHAHGLAHSATVPVTGNWIVNTDPSPGLDSTRTRPPWLLATWRTMASPSPVPPVSRLRARSTR